MARDWTLLRQEAEDIVELLEENPTRVIHDKTALEAAAELRQLFGMCTREQENELIKK